jgi:hypothetical protein
VLTVGMRRVINGALLKKDVYCCASSVRFRADIR